MSLNSHIIEGRIGTMDARVTPNGNHVVNLTVATNDRWTDASGNKVERTDWHRVSVFGKLADVVPRIAQVGSHVFIQGPVRVRNTERDGVTYRNHDIILGGPRSVFQHLGNGKPRAGDASEPETPNAAPIEPDDIPF